MYLYAKICVLVCKYVCVALDPWMYPYARPLLRTIVRMHASVCGVVVVYLVIYNYYQLIVIFFFEYTNIFKIKRIRRITFNTDEHLYPYLNKINIINRDLTRYYIISSLYVYNK